MAANEWRKGTRGPAEGGRLDQTSGKENEWKETSPKPGSPGQKRRKIVSPHKEGHEYAVPWAIVR